MWDSTSRSPFAHSSPMYADGYTRTPSVIVSTSCGTPATPRRASPLSSAVTIRSHVSSSGNLVDARMFGCPAISRATSRSTSRSSRLIVTLWITGNGPARNTGTGGESIISSRRLKVSRTSGAEPATVHYPGLSSGVRASERVQQSADESKKSVPLARQTDRAEAVPGAARVGEERRDLAAYQPVLQDARQAHRLCERHPADVTP